MPDVTSSAIRHLDYRAAERALLVTFVSGAVYCYAGVPAKVYAAFEAAESKGRFFMDEIRDCYPTTKMR